MTIIVHKAFSILVPATLLIVFSAQFAACEKYVLPDLQVAADTLHFTAAADSQAVAISTNVITTLYSENNDTWVKAYPEWIDASRTVYIKVSENTSQEQRTATIPIKSEAIQRNLVVIQEGGEGGEYIENSAE